MSPQNIVSIVMIACLALGAHLSEAQELLQIHAACNYAGAATTGDVYGFVGFGCSLSAAEGRMPQRKFFCASGPRFRGVWNERREGEA